MAYEHDTLLPGNATPLESTLSDVNDDFGNLVDEYTDVHSSILSTPPQFLPWLVWQYGLGELSPYLPNLYNLISQGLHWQRIRGTPGAISMGLGWLGYAGSLEEVPTRRRRWNRFQWHLDRVRDADTPDLIRIDGIVSLSPPKRSVFARCFNGYDVRALEWSFRRWSSCLYSHDSGTFMAPAGAKWSFGRIYDRDTSFTQAELTALGAWIDEVPDSDLWSGNTNLWSGEDFLWSAPAAVARRKAIAEAVLTNRAYIRFADQGGATIGYARATLHPASSAFGGQYLFGSTGWKVDEDAPTAIVAIGTSGFGCGAGSSAASLSVLFGPTLADGVKPGTLWLTPSQLSGGHVVASYPITIAMGLTVRERARFLLRIP